MLANRDTDRKCNIYTVILLKIVETLRFQRVPEEEILRPFYGDVDKSDESRLQSKEDNIR
jgi:hypothetical protein